ncbi:glycosyltransferase family 2 protein [Streptomyces sp. NPDC006923]|uniref:glycosyltransferase family 2 protein n=1 Tax=Streptomyces sp. NPDC006923 TaxID=3155355 RepID=UPI0033FBDA9F
MDLEFYRKERLLMSGVISVITPVHRAGLAYLSAAYDSLASQHLPSGWSWEWLVQEDGGDVDSAAVLPSDSRIHIAASRKGGPHVTRTVSLGRSSGDLIKNLDSDDVLSVGVLARDIEVLTNHPDVGWTTSAVIDLLPDGSTTTFPGDPVGGRIQRTAVYRHWSQHRRAQVHPATICARRDLVLALGGWMALPASGDTGLLLGLDAVADGWFHTEVGLQYRKHEGQITADPRHTKGPEWEARMAVIGEHARALHSLIAGEAPNVLRSNSHPIS